MIKRYNGYITEKFINPSNNFLEEVENKIKHTRESDDPISVIGSIEGFDGVLFRNNRR